MKKDLRLEPHSVKDGRYWWYEMPGGIEIHVPVCYEHAKFTIRWDAIRGALERKDAK